MDSLAQHQLLIVCGTAGSGRSSQLLAHYGTAPLIRLDSPGPAEVVYSNSSQTDYFYSALRLVLEIHHTKEGGDIVVFLASGQEIDCAHDILREEGAKLSPDLGELVPVPLCPAQGAGVPSVGEDLDRNVKAPGRRVFLTTSQGEDLFWAIDTVNFVIDAGMEKREVYNPRIRANSLLVRPISRSQAEIRKQIIGSTGKCFCLYPEEARLPEETPPHILESNITSTVLFLKRMEIAGLGHCEFLDRPDPEGLMQALEELDYLAALDDDGNLSEIGIIMSEFPLDPQMAKALLASCEFDCVSEVLTIAAMLTAPSCFLEPPRQAALGSRRAAQYCYTKFQHPEGDHFALVNIYNAYKQSQHSNPEQWCQDCFLSHAALQTADAIRSELTDILKRIELPISEPSFGTKGNAKNVKRALLSGFFMQLFQPEKYGGLIFTSPRAVEALRRCLEGEEDWIQTQKDKWKDKPVYVVGKATAALVQEVGLVPRGEDTGNADKLSTFICEQEDARSRPLLFPCGSIKREVLPTVLKQNGVPLECLMVYQTAKHPHLDNNLNEYFTQQGIPASIAFFSPSGVKFCLKTLQRLSGKGLEKIQFAAIGPTTADALSAEGLPVSCTARKPTAQDLAAAIAEALH
ncbi:DHX32 helicase, partial [Amia calva]|nr:DHX32 helicase [Amia calva]